MFEGATFSNSVEGITAATGVRVTPTAPIIERVRRRAARRRLIPPSV
jgi:hypothetical protein